MAWRLQLSESTIKRLDILSGRPSLLAAWVRTDHVVFLDLQSGIQKSELTIEPAELRDRTGEAWKTFLGLTRSPNSACLPMVRAKGGVVFSSSDGTKRLNYAGGRDLYLDVDGTETRLDQPATDADSARLANRDPFVAVGMDRAFGIVAALDTSANLTLFNERTRVGVFATGLTISDEFRPILLVTKGSSTILITDGRKLLAMDSSGRVRSSIDLHYTIGAMGCSSDGRRLVISDQDANVVRVYSGTDLRPTHQRHSVDLLAEAKRAQLLSMPEAGRAAIGPLAINSKGVLAFAIAGTLCVTSLARMKSVPRPVV